MEWRSIEPLKDSEADQVLKDPILKKRCLRSRSTYRDKNRGSGQLRAKCRVVVALGHNDPDLKSLTRSAPTPGRITEHILYCLIVAGINGTLLYDGALWMAWLGDAMTAFLQGLQPDNERPLPLFLLPPRDPLTHPEKWPVDEQALQSPGQYIYGLPNAPHLWCTEVASRLMSRATSVTSSIPCSSILKATLSRAPSWSTSTISSESTTPTTTSTRCTISSNGEKSRTSSQMYQ